MHFQLHKDMYNSYQKEEWNKWQASASFIAGFYYYYYYLIKFLALRENWKEKVAKAAQVTEKKLWKALK